MYRSRMSGRNRRRPVGDAVGCASYTYTHDDNWNMTSDSRKNLQISYNVLNLPMTAISGMTVKSQYKYFPDGSKLSALAGSGAGYKYRGSFVYSVDASWNERLESVACDEFRISVTYNSSSTPLNRWRQSGKEEQVIDGNDLGQLDFGARHYDPWLARWTQVTGRIDTNQKLQDRIQTAQKVFLTYWDDE